MKATLFFCLLLMAHQAFATKLTFVADHQIETGFKFRGTEIGGLSATVYDSKRKQFLALSDDRSKKAPARLYRFRLGFKESKGKVALELRPTSVVTLKQHNYTSFPKGSIDPEGLVLTPQYELYISSEGDGLREPRIPPRIYKMIFSPGSQNARVQNEFPVPARFIPQASGIPTQGILPNAGFESLTAGPEGSSHLYSATELPLIQDSNPPTFEKGGAVRVSEWNTQKSPAQLTREWVYPLDPVPRPEELKEDWVIKKMANGLTELLAIPGKTNSFLALERGWVQVKKKGTFMNIRLYRFSFTGATEVQTVSSLKKSKRYRPVKKELLLNFDEIISKLSEPQELDNLEALSWGPLLPNGHRSLLVTADNNFSNKQRNLFLVFQWDD